MVVLPIFWDQHDNAQRIDETRLGTRLDTYRHDRDQLTGAIERLLGDDDLGQRLSSLSGQLQAQPGTERAAELVEQVLAAG
jgi:UDP:flavonoid glycosyltransferase YjiC (YdhE family)